MIQKCFFSFVNFIIQHFKINIKLQYAIYTYKLNVGKPCVLTVIEIPNTSNIFAHASQSYLFYFNIKGSNQKHDVKLVGLNKKDGDSNANQFFIFAQNQEFQHVATKWQLPENYCRFGFTFWV